MLHIFELISAPPWFASESVERFRRDQWFLVAKVSVEERGSHVTAACPGQWQEGFEPEPSAFRVVDRTTELL